MERREVRRMMDADVAATKQVLSALRRLLNLERLKAIDAPEPLIKNAEQRVEEARKAFGDDAWAKIEEEFPKYKHQVTLADAAFKEWEEKCLRCAHCTGNDYSHSGKWCALYTREETSAPAPCPSFRLKVLN